MDNNNNTNKNNIPPPQPSQPQPQQYNQQFNANELEKLGRGWKRIQHRNALTANDNEKRDMNKKIQKFRSYDFLLRQEEAKRWIESMLDTKIFFEHHIPTQSPNTPSSLASNGQNGRSPSPPIDPTSYNNSAASTDFFHQLRDGVTLCRLAQCWMTGEEPRLKMKKYHSNVNAKKGSPLELMIATDNVHTFFQCCRAIEFPQFYDFTVPDLWERKNIWQVVHCIHALAHFLDRQGLLKSDALRIQDLTHSGIQFSVEEMERAEQDFIKMEQMNLKIDYDFIKSSDDRDGENEDEELQVSVHSVFLSEDDTALIDPDQCTIEGKGADTAVAGEQNKFYIVMRNKRGEVITDQTAQHEFLVNLVMLSNPSIVVTGQCVDLGDGRHEVTYVPTVAGRYTWDITLDNDKKLTHKSIGGVRVMPGDVCVQNCVVIDPHNLQVNQTEGETFSFHIQARDKCGNKCINGGYKFQRAQLLYFGNNLKNKPIDSSRFLTVTDMSNGIYEVSAKNCLPGQFQLSIGDEHNLVPSLHPFSLQVGAAPVPKLRVKFEDFSAYSGVAQFKVMANDNSQENTRYVSVVCIDSIGASLSSDVMSNTEDVFRTEFVNWVNMTRKSIFDQLTNPTQSQMDEDEIFLQSKKDRVWGALNKIPNEYKCQSIKASLNNKKIMPSPVAYVVISDDYVDWSQYDRMLIQKKEEQERMEKEMREQEEKRVRDQKEAEERAHREELEKLNTPSQPVAPVQPAVDPNQFTVQPRLCAFNFWVVLSNLITKCINQKTNAKYLDSTNTIMSYETPEVKIRQMSRPDVYITAKKKDIKSFGDLLLTISQRYIFEVMEELQVALGKDYPLISVFISKECKKAFAEFASIHQVFEKLMESPDADFALGGETMLAEVDKNMRKKAKTLLLGYKRILFQTIMNNNSRLIKEIQRRLPMYDDYRMERIEKQCQFFKTAISDVFNGFLRATAFTMSSQERRIMVQELSFLKPVDLTRNDPASPMVQTKSFSIQIPINSLFDSCMYKSKTNRSTKDRFRAGLVNPYKIAYIKDNRVVIESIRSGSLTAIGIEDKNERDAVTCFNAVELLRTLAANHAKRFTRKELEDLNSRHESLNIPFTSVSLLTPFFLNNREDRQLIEHTQALIDMVEQNKVNSITIDPYDGLLPVTVAVQFKDPCLMNVGTNVVIKTLMLGIGIQRAVNAREYGVRRYEEKIQKFLVALGSHKQMLRQHILQYLNSVFGSTREGAMYKDTLVKRLEQVESAYYCLCRDQNETKRKRHVLEFELKTKQVELERKMREDWIPYFDQATSVEITYQTKIKYLVNEIYSIMHSLYKIECKYESRYDEIIETEQAFIKELHNTILNMQQSNKMFQAPSRWGEYCEFVQKEKDIYDLYSDFRFLFHEGMHEKFSQGLVETSHVKEIDPYALPVRVIILSFLIGEQGHFNCKSGKDRTGELHDQIQEFAELREQFNEYPKQRVEKKLFNYHRQHIHTNIALNGGSLEIIKQNLGVPGSKADAAVSGRFKEGFYQKYKGLSNVDNLTYAPNLDYWKNWFNLSHAV